MSRFISRISFRIEINSWISCWDMPGSGDPVEAFPNPLVRTSSRPERALFAGGVVVPSNDEGALSPRQIARQLRLGEGTVRRTLKGPVGSMEARQNPAAATL
jgi:hypothetical protein